MADHGVVEDSQLIPKTKEEEEEERIESAKREEGRILRNFRRVEPSEESKRKAEQLRIEQEEKRIREQAAKEKMDLKLAQWEEAKKKKQWEEEEKKKQEAAAKLGQFVFGEK